jgi:dCTP deaminase
MAIIALTANQPGASVVTSNDDFSRDGSAILLQNSDPKQLADQENDDCNTSYDLRVGETYRDHRNRYGQHLGPDGVISLLPGNAVIIETEESVKFPKTRFGQILPRVSLLQQGIANTPSKIDPGYEGVLLISVFNHGKQTVPLHRGERFCSLHVFDVAGPVRPYDKPGKRILGARQSPGLTHRVLDWIEANVAIMVFVQMAVALAALAKAFWSS